MEWTVILCHPADNELPLTIPAREEKQEKGVSQMERATAVGKTVQVGKFYARYCGNKNICLALANFSLSASCFCGMEGDEICLVATIPSHSPTG